MNDEAAKFWSDFEAETGEKVQARAIGTYFEPGDERGVWGLLILTDASFRFKHLPSENWISALFKSHRNAPSPSRAIDIVVPRAEISSLDEPRRGPLARLFGPVFPRFTLAWEGGARRETFAADPSSDLLRGLREAAGR
ncbi:MAG TPA: hypothetical protein PLB91_03460 [Spirochaetales bacterium]|nr:hypothetical protein [Spirochaetales bacterium]HRY54866.1 hypothetical protein [Spirochaetia bacterium]HRZ63598.1 hypothetical protein [Spirochaetia bacterium]